MFSIRKSLCETARTQHFGEVDVELVYNNTRKGTYEADEDVNIAIEEGIGAYEQNSCVDSG